MGIIMGCGRALICLLLPPLAVLDKGCGAVLLTTVLWLCGWIPGTIAAIIFCSQNDGHSNNGNGGTTE